MDEPVHGEVDGEVDGEVGRLWLNRPHARNAITVELARALHDHLVDLAGRVRVIVVRGVGGHFCAGGDIGEVTRLRAIGPEALRPLFEAFGEACAVIARLPVPVVVAVEGAATAGGFELLQAADIAVVRDDAVLADNHLTVGQIPGGGSSQRLPRLVGRPRATAHILLGERLSGRDAVAWGLAHRSADADGFEAAVDDVVARLVAKDPAALARAKRLIHEGLELPLTEGLARERDEVVAHLGDEAAGAALRAFGGGRGSG